MSEWLLFNANSAIFQLYHGKNKLIFDEMMMRSALYKTNTLSWIFIVLAHWNKCLRINISPNKDTLSWFQANLSLLFLLNVFGLTEWGSNPRSTTLEVSMLTITPPMRSSFMIIKTGGHVCKENLLLYHLWTWEWLVHLQCIRHKMIQRTLRIRSYWLQEADGNV